MEQDTLILLTGAYRFDNLINVADSVREYIHNKINYIWLICKDQYNGYGDFDQFIEYCKLHQLRVVVSSTGKPDQKNYGGDLFNEPLKELVEYKKLDSLKTFIYILDDDNRLHPYFLIAYNKFRTQWPNHSILWLPYIQANGEITHVWKGAEFAMDKPQQFFFNSPDPSCMVFRLDKLESVNYFPSGSSYDVNYRDTLIKPNIEEIAFSNYIEPFDYNRITAASHNFVRTKEDIEEDKKLLDNDEPNDVSLRLQLTEDKTARCYPMSRELAKIVLSLIEIEYKHKGFIK